MAEGSNSMAGGTLDVLKSGMAAVQSGKEVTSDNIESGGSELSTLQLDTDDEYRAENSTVDDILPQEEGGDTPQDSSEGTPETKADAKAPVKDPKTSSKEVITVTEANGQKRKIEIDYADREAIKKAHLLASGARKWQADRDQAIQRLKKTESEVSEIRQNWNDLEKAYTENGLAGLVDRLEGNGAWNNLLQKAVQKAKFLENASPEEVEAFNIRDELDRTKRDNDKIRKDNEKFKKEVSEEREQTETRELQSRIYPSFTKHRFEGKLGSTEDEHMFDEMLWNTAMKRLEPYDQQGLDLTLELVEKEFSAVARAIRKRVTAQAEKKAERVVQQKKQEATENVQAKVMSGYKQGGKAKEARDLIESGNLTGLLKGWGKYGGLFNK